LLVEGFLERSAALRPGAVALVCGGRRYTYGWLDGAANRLACALQARGLRRGDRVVIQLENSVETLVALFATLKAGGVFVLVNPTVKSAKLRYILQDCEAAVIVADHRARSETTRALAGASSIRLLVAVSVGASVPQPEEYPGIEVISLDSLLEQDGSDERPSTRAIDLDLAALVYTSGSTGRPKGVMLTHANMVAAATSIDSYLQNTADDVILDVLPLSFDYGLYQVFLAFKAGARLVLERSFAYPTVLLELLEEERVTALPLVPMMAALLVRQELSAYDLSSLRYITNTGAVLPPAHIAELRRQVPQVQIFSMYGLTECKRVSFLAPEQIDRRPSSVGKAMDNVEVFVIDDKGQRRETGVGELVVRGSNVMQGYWRAPEETARALRECPPTYERLLYTGDLFRIDEDGFLHFLGRNDDMIKSRGEKVSPREVEGVLHELPGVIEAVVVGVPDAVLGQAVKAFLKLDPGVQLSEQQVSRHAAERLEDFMVPQIVEFVATMPRTASGKIDRRELPVQVQS
jgi:long-chain acyl-CoA synthetase